MTNTIVKGKSLKGDTSFIRLPGTHHEPRDHKETKSSDDEEKKDEDFDLSVYRDMVESDKGLVQYIIQRRKRLMEEFNHLEMRIKELERRKKELRNREQNFQAEEDKLSSEINKIKAEETNLSNQLKEEEKKLGQDFNGAIKDLNKKEETVSQNNQTTNPSSKTKGESMGNDSPKASPAEAPRQKQVAVEPRKEGEDDKKIKERLEQRYEELIKEIRGNQPRVSNEQILNKVNEHEQGILEEMTNVEHKLQQNSSKLDENAKNKEWLQQKLEKIEEGVNKASANSGLKQQLDNYMNQLNEQKTREEVSNQDILDYIKGHRQWVERRLSELEGEIQEEKNSNENLHTNVNMQTQDTGKSEENDKKRNKESKPADSSKEKTAKNVRELLKKIDDKDSEKELKLDPDKLSHDEKKEHIYKMINETMSLIGEEKYEKAQELLKEITYFYNSLEGHVVDKHRIYEEVAEIKRFINSKLKE